MASWTIVALPREDDRVMGLSSEKVPHMTLLFLGEQKDPAKAARIAEYIEHVTENTLKPFGMSVFRRGELGPDKADVLFFDEEYITNIAAFRNNLLKNDDIASAVASTFQYPKWTPHLTMGYPETPAKELPPGDYPPTWVEFDRIAFWVDDYDGPEYIIPRPRLSEMTEDSAMAMSEEGVSVDPEKFLAHYGVKGMKWGVRKAAKIEKAAAAKRERSSEDAKAAQDAQTKLKKSSIDSLSNKELQTLVTRMNLEQQLSGLQAKTATKSAGRKFVEDIAKEQFKNTVSGAIKDSVGAAGKKILADQINKKLNLNK